MYLINPIRHIRRFASCARLSPFADAFNGCYPSLDVITGSCGLFKNNLLKTPQGFSDLVIQASDDCKHLVAEATSATRSRKMVRILDDISDTLCRVADLADCIRMLHPDPGYRNAASEACHSIGCLVEQLNTNSDLYLASVRAVDADRSLRSSDLIDDRVLQLFIADFELSGVQLSDWAAQKEFLSSASEVLSTGAQFSQVAHSPYLLRVADLSPGVRKLLSTTIAGGDLELYHPILDHPLADIRAASHRAFYSPIAGQEQRLYDLVSARHRMARSAGFTSFADRALRHSVAETPDCVSTFLQRLQRLLRPTARRTAVDLLAPALKGHQQQPVVLRGSRQQLDTLPSGRIWPWDVPFALMMRRMVVQHEELRHFFSLGACMEGVSQLAECLFNLSLRVEPVVPGETWHPSVLKVAVYSTGDRRSSMVGLVYCDLLDRPEKPMQDCHYTIQGGRELNDNGGGLAVDYQIPIITIQLNLTPSDVAGEPPLLTFGQVENLFHEWGHALHSMVARTRYQHVTGTRCSTDLAELPSTLFEHFGLDARVMMEYARHWSSGRGPDWQERAALHHVALARGLGQSVELAQQATYAYFDQCLHSGDPDTLLPGHNDLGCLPSAKLLADIQQEAGLSDWLVCESAALETIGCWPHRFTHLIGYGSRYYAYLMARAGAGLVWHRCFLDDPWSSTMGQLYTDRLLRHGGEHPPAQMLTELLDASGGDCQAGEHSRLLSPSRLSEGLAGETERQEESAAALLTRLESPGLHQPRSGR